ncbi:MAG: hypothetical protein EBU54_16370 [Mycobacteriaceae bacterium]|nr:hypothetical protein [Mycobacteriaceae bacterium]
MNIPRIGAIAAVTICSAALLVGCGSSSSSDTTSAASTAASTTGQKVGGASKCDQASISKAVESTSTKEGPVTLATSTSFKCADGWAYAFVNVGTGSTQYTATQVFEAEGQFWIPKDRMKVCKSPGNQVPAAIYQDACNTN